MSKADEIIDMICGGRIMAAREAIQALEANRGVDAPAFMRRRAKVLRACDPVVAQALCEVASDLERVSA